MFLMILNGIKKPTCITIHQKQRDLRCGPSALIIPSAVVMMLVFQAPAGMQVLMSATQSTFLKDEGVYQFYMEYPVPAYLVALVAGDLVHADIGPR